MDLKELRGRLRKMTHAESIVFGNQMHKLAYPLTHGYRGKPNVSVFSIRLQYICQNDGEVFEIAVGFGREGNTSLTICIPLHHGSHRCWQVASFQQGENGKERATNVSGAPMRISVMVLMLACFLATAAPAKADAIYTLDSAGFGFSWSFEVPGIITTDTTITNFLSTFVLPTGFFGGCPIDSATILPNPNPQGFSGVNTTFSTSCGGESNFGFFGPITGFGTFILADDTTLTVSSAVATPEPASLLLLGTGLMVMLGAKRRMDHFRRIPLCVKIS